MRQHFYNSTGNGSIRKGDTIEDANHKRKPYINRAEVKQENGFHFNSTFMFYKCNRSAINYYFNRHELTVRFFFKKKIII